MFSIHIEFETNDLKVGSHSNDLSLKMVLSNMHFHSPQLSKLQKSFPEQKTLTLLRKMNSMSIAANACLRFA